MERTIYILVCWQCDPEGERPLSFETAQARGRWAAEHRAATGHDQWWCPDIVDADGPGIRLEGSWR